MTPSDHRTSRDRVALFALVLGALASSMSAQYEQQHIYTFNGTITKTRFGYGIDSAGDANKDGVPDIVVGADWGSTTYRAGSVTIISGRDGRVLHRFVGDGTDDRLGTWVSGAGDLNGDGYDDVVAGAHLDDNKGQNSGMVRAFSGKDGKVLWSIDGSQAGARFGECVDAGGDVNKDGVPDVIVGAPQDEKTLTFKEGSVTVLSGKDGKQIYKFYGDKKNDQLGKSVCSIGDINGDGYADFAAGSHIVDNGTTVDAGLVRVYSGKDGKVIKNLYGAATDVRFGAFIAAGKVNKDGFPDLIVFAVRDTTGNLTRAGSVTVISGLWVNVNVGKKELWKLYGSYSNGAFGHALGFAGDVNKDGYGDVLVGQPSDDKVGQNAGCAYVFSGLDGKELMKFYGDSAGDNRGNRVVGAGDINGDGWPDILTGAMWDDNTAVDAGSVTVWSSKPLTLTTDTHTASVAASGKQTFRLFGGTANANKLYFLLGSLSGTTPGIKLGTTLLPLNPDAYFSATAGIPNAWLMPSFGKLDGSGKATVQFLTFPQIPASLLGIPFDHAYVVFRTNPISFDLASNSVPLTLAK